MKILILFLLIIGYMSNTGCNNNASNASNQTYPFQFVGVIEKTEFTVYMYGSHTINADNKTYALQSTSVNLDEFVNQKVQVKGTKVEGYPVDDGPELIDVKVIEKQ